MQANTTERATYIVGMKNECMNIDMLREIVSHCLSLGLKMKVLTMNTDTRFGGSLKWQDSNRTKVPFVYCWLIVYDLN